jgi:hypothetical protein
VLPLSLCCHCQSARHATGDHVKWLDVIERDGAKARLGRCMVPPKDACRKLGSY